MITKIYKAPSVIAINLYVGEKKIHLKFDSDSNGRGYYITSDKRLIKALDDKLKNGNPQYYLSQVIDSEKAEEPTGQIEDTSAPAIIEVDVDNIVDAKEYLCSRFEDITRSGLKTKRAIFEAAAAHNIVFKGITP